MRARTVVLLGTAGAVALAVRHNKQLDRTPLAHPDEGERLTVTTSDGAELVVEVCGRADGPVVVLPTAGAATSPRGAP